MQAPEQHNSTLIKILSWQHSYTHIIKNTFTVIHYSSICTHTGVHSSTTHSYWCALITHSLILVCTHHPLAHTGVHSSPTRSYWCALITHSLILVCTHHPLAHTGVHSSPTHTVLVLCTVLLITHSYCTRTVYSTTHHPLLISAISGNIIVHIYTFTLVLYRLTARLPLSLLVWLTVYRLSIFVGIVV